MKRTNILALCCGLLCGLWLAEPLRAEGEKDGQKAIDSIVKKNIFAPYKAPPKPRPKIKTPTRKPDKPKVVRELREDLVVTGFLWDNTAKAFIALVETRDGQKRLSLYKGMTCGDYTVEVVLEAKISLIQTKTKKREELELGAVFKGSVIGKQEVYASSSSPSRTSPGKTKPVGKPLPKLSGEKKMSIMERLKARRKAQMEKKRGKK